MSAADDTFRMLAGLLEAGRLMPEAVRAAPRSLPLTVIGGFLGAGKTTLLNRLLVAPHGRRLAVLVNDFGRINIDASLVRSRTPDTIALTNGCACCTVSGDLTRALIDLSQREEPPEAIVLEASGIADPRGLAQVALSNPALRLDGLVTVVDAETVRSHASDAEYGALFRTQVDAADLVVLTKRDLVSAEALQAAREWIAMRAPGIGIVEAVHGDVPAELLLGLESGHDIHGTLFAPDHANVFRSEVIELDAPIDEDALLALVEAAAGEVLRAKGIVRLAATPDRRTIFQQVGRRHAFVTGEAWDGDAVSRVVVIARRH
jgi:G3E family GTPase